MSENAGAMGVSFTSAELNKLDRELEDIQIIGHRADAYSESTMDK